MKLIPFLTHVGARIRLARFLEGGAWGAGIGMVALLLLRPDAWGAQLFILAVGAGLGAGMNYAWAARRDPKLQRAAVAAVEAGVPESRNVVLTAAESLTSAPARDARDVRDTRDTRDVRDRILNEALRVTEGADPRTLVPIRRPLAGVAAAGLGWVLVLWGLAGAPGSPIALPAGLIDAADWRAAEPGSVALAIQITVTPPSYLGLPTVTLDDPDRVEAIKGSRIQVVVRGAPGSAPLEGAVLERVEGRQGLDALEGGGFSGRFVAEGDGFLAVDGWGGSEARRLIGLSVRPDRLPDLRVMLPGEDLRVPDGNRVISVTIEAEDDFALTQLELRFTRVTGFGELFTFEEGTVPLEIERVSPRRWNATARWDLLPLVLERGDLVVYRAVARDARPDGAEGESDTWAIEVVSPDAVAAAGGGSNEDFDRYAMSQQMVVMLTERLIARREELSEDDFIREVQTLAAAQRRVRAEFVFMLGGELADDHEHDPNDEEYLRLHEEAHALADANVAEGRLAHLGRQELSRAVQSMSRALTGLDAFDLERALLSERAALVALQRAFSSSRYILRALSERETLDFTRRLTGNTAGALPDRRPGTLGAEDPQVQALRAVLATLAPLAGGSAGVTGAAGATDTTTRPGTTTRPEADRSRQASDLALAVFRIDPTSEPFQLSGDVLRRAADALAAGRTEAAAPLLNEAFSHLVAELRTRVEPAPPPPPTLGLGRLLGALMEGNRR